MLLLAIHAIFLFVQENVEAMKGIAGGLTMLFEGLSQGVPVYDVNRKDITVQGKGPHARCNRHDLPINSCATHALLCTGVDGNKIPLSIYQGTSKTCYYHTHGGGMAFLSSRAKPFTTVLNHLSGKHGMGGVHTFPS